MKRLIRKFVRALGFDIVRYGEAPGRPESAPDLTTQDRAILAHISDYTMTSVERQIELIQAARHVARSGLSGSIVECGVWRGGSMMAVAMALQQEGVSDRELYLFDTFEGMTAPTANDRTPDGVLAQVHLDRSRKGDGYWCFADIETVRRNLVATRYPAERIHLVQGPVEKTLPGQVPSAPIALLRLDTDWFESTKHELEHLFPRLREGGILIIDDYGHWQGARKATDEFLARQEKKYYLHRIDYTGRLLVKW